MHMEASVFTILIIVQVHLSKLSNGILLIASEVLQPQSFRLPERMQSVGSRWPTDNPLASLVLLLKVTNRGLPVPSPESMTWLNNQFIN